MDIPGLKKLRFFIWRTLQFKALRYLCPVCEYSGPFRELTLPAGGRLNALCPSCGAYERHRLQYLVMKALFEQKGARHMKMLHVAPEKILQDFFSSQVGSYQTGDLAMNNVDYQINLEKLPFADASYDLVFASHVLEHVMDDKAAITEISRILKPGGMAVLPVPLVSQNTLDYSEPNLKEDNHVRAPGLDYFDRYRKEFAQVILYSSEDFPEKYQLYIYEDRSRWPTPDWPLRQPMFEEKYLDVVPICLKSI